MPAMSESWRPAASREILQLRARMLKDVRAFFDQRGVLEVETPLLSSSCTTDPNINSFSTRYQYQGLYLNTSPEYCMKRLLAAHGDPIYQICKSFRDDELGPNHNPEFTMLEWYRPGFDMFELMEELGDLVQMLASNYKLNSSIINKMSFAEAYHQATGINPYATSAEECLSCALKYGIEQPAGLEDDIDEWLNWLLIQFARTSSQFLSAVTSPSIPP